MAWCETCATREHEDLAFALNQVLTLLLRPKLLFSLHWFWFLFCTKQMIRTYLWHLPALANHNSVVAHFCPFRRIVIVVLTRTRAKTAVRLLAGCSRAGMAQACWWRYDTDDPALNHQRFQVFMIGFVYWICQIWKIRGVPFPKWPNHVRLVKNDMIPPSVGF